MKRLSTILLAAIITTPFAFVGCGGAKSIKTDTDSLSYAIGVDIGSNLKGFSEMYLNNELDADLVAQAIKDVFNDKAKFDAEEAVEFAREYQQVRIPERKLAESKEYLNDLARQNKNIQQTESGLMYEIIEPGDLSQKATDNRDVVVVMYEGRLKDDTVFDSSYEKGDTARFALNQVIPGWTEGLKLVGPGGKLKLYIPGDLGYGMRGEPRAGIGMHDPLIFDVEVIEVIPVETE